jgi:hypothetical protein
LAAVQKLQYLHCKLDIDDPAFTRLDVPTVLEILIGFLLTGVGNSLNFVYPRPLTKDKIEGIADTRQQKAN